MRQRKYTPYLSMTILMYFQFWGVGTRSIKVLKPQHWFNETFDKKFFEAKSVESAQYLDKYSVMNA